jgi:hypothetical protein
MPAHSTALAKAPRTPPSVSPSPVPVSSQLIRQTPRVSQCPDRPPPETALESSACECNLLPRDRRLVHLLLARHGPLMHACTAAAPSPKVICSRGSSCRRVQQYVSFRHSTFPLGYLVMHFLWASRPGTRLDEERVRVRIMHAVMNLTELCLNHRQTLFKQASAISSHVTMMCSIRYKATSHYIYHTLSTSKLAIKCLLQINLTGFPNAAKRRCKHAQMQASRLIANYPLKRQARKGTAHPGSSQPVSPVTKPRIHVALRRIRPPNSRRNRSSRPSPVCQLSCLSTAATSYHQRPTPSH